MIPPRSQRAVRPVMEAADLEKCALAFEAELDFICRALRRNGINGADAEDLAHEIFLVMWRRWADYDRERPLRPWLAGIAYRVAYNHRERIGREVPAGLVDRQDENADPESRMASRRARALVLQALERVPEKHRAVLVLHDLESLPMREIADLMAIPLFTAYSRLRVGRKAFAAAVRRSQAIGATAAAGLRPEALLEDERQEAPVALPSPARRRILTRMRAALLLPGLGAGEAGGPPPAGPSPGPGQVGILHLALPVGVLVAVVLVGFGLGTHHPAPTRPLPAPAAAALPRPASALAPLPPTRRRVVALRPGLGAPLAPAPGEPGTAALGVALVGYWRFDEGGASAQAHDLSGNGIDCGLRQMDPASAWTDGPLGRALDLDGTGWLDCGRLEGLSRSSGELTLALWVRRGSKHKRVQALVSRQLDRDSRDFFHFGFRDDLLILQSKAWGVTLAVPFGHGLGRWVHVAGVLGRDRHARIYIDGREVGSKRTGPLPTGHASTPLIVGGGVNAPDQISATEAFEGSLDELLVYDRALGAEEIEALAAGTQPHL